MANILVAAQDTNSVNAIVGTVSLLQEKGHCVSVYSTGPERTRGAFGFVPYEVCLNMDESKARKLLEGKDLLLTGLSGYDSSDGILIEEAEKIGVKSIGMSDRDYNWEWRFGNDSRRIPYRVGVISGRSIEAIRRSLPEENREVVLDRARVVGPTILDELVKLRETDFDRESFLGTLKGSGYEIPDKIVFYATQNALLRGSPGFLDYAIRSTTESFRTAKELGIRLLVKGHPAEREGGVTEILAENYGHIPLPFESCNARELIRASDAVVAGKSDILVEACVLDRNVGGIFIEPTKAELKRLSGEDAEAHYSLLVISQNAIPYSETIGEIKDVFKKITSEDPEVLMELAEQRKNLRADGRANENLVSLVEETLV